MKLYEWSEFEQAINAAAAAAEFDQRFVEKDYWVTTVLRLVVDELPDKTIFKGGTSLSKGWKLIDRFSEDIDLFVDPTAWEPELSTNGITRTLRKLKERVEQHPALTYVPDLGQTIKGFSREDTFAYGSLYDELPGLPPTVRLEPGIQSGRQPTAIVALNSIVAEFLLAQGQGDVADDLHPFDMTLLHFRRTFVEKLFTIHGKIERLVEEGHAIGRDARHYADLHALAGRDEVLAMIRSDEYGEIKADYDETSRKYFPKTYRPPPDLSFRNSDALFPAGELRAQIDEDYTRECRVLFANRPYPSIKDVIARLEEIRDLL